MHEWVGLTVAQVLALCGTAYEDVTLHDEPPGKLRTVQFLCRKLDPPVRVTVEIEYDSALFSRDRSWPRALVESRRVVAVPGRGGGGS